MRTALAALMAACALHGQTPGEKDVVLRAMRDEIARARQLRLVDAPPYFVEYSLDDGEFYMARAALGALVSERSSRDRYPRIRVRVGDPKLDNSNHIASDFYRGSRFDPFRYPLEDNYDTLRHCFWLATDRAYKQALEALARKKSSLKNVSSTESLSDFGPAPPVKLILPNLRKPLDAAQWRERARDLSRVYLEFPEIAASEVSVYNSQTISYQVNNEGADLRFPDNMAYYRARATAIAADGARVHDMVELVALEDNQLPALADVKAAIRKSAETLRALAKAPAGESYSGPVLFEGTAGAQYMAQALARNLSVTRKPITDPDRPLNIPTGELEGRIGSRILPEWIDVVDDPTQPNWRGRPLIGSYPVDAEGVVPKALPLVQKGVLKTYYASRQPVTGVEASNGHGRIPGALGGVVPLPGVVFVKSSQAMPAADLRKRLLEMGRNRSKPYVVVIRKLDFPASASGEELSRAYRGMQRAGISIPLMAYKVYPDGREELMRGVRFRGLDARTMKDIAAASDEQHLFEYYENAAPFARVDSGGYVAGTSVIAPSLLFEDVELEPIPGDLTRPPIVPPPPLAN